MLGPDWMCLHLSIAERLVLLLTSSGPKCSEMGNDACCVTQLGQSPKTQPAAPLLPLLEPERHWWLTLVEYQLSQKKWCQGPITKLPASLHLILATRPRSHCACIP